MKTYLFLTSTCVATNRQMRLVNGRAVKKEHFDVLLSQLDEIEDLDTKTVVGKKRGKTYVIDRFVGTIY